MNHIKQYRFLALAAQIEEDPKRKEKLQAALRKLESEQPNIRRVYASNSLSASEGFTETNPSDHAA